MITSEIQPGTFDYAQRGPTSKNAKRFSTIVRICTFEALSESFLETKEFEVIYASLRNMKSAIKIRKLIVGTDTFIYRQQDGT